jgi:hypothetical protein
VLFLVATSQGNCDLYHVQKGNSAIYNSMDKPGGHYGQCNEPGTERQTPQLLTYVWKQKKMSTSQKQREEWWLPKLGVVGGQGDAGERGNV